VSLSTGYGGYTSNGKIIGDIRKQAIEYSSGLIDGRWSFAGRYSKMFSDGYRRDSWYDGWSYFLSLSRLDPNMVTTVNAYGGPMRMHLAYDGIDRQTMEDDRRSNPLTYPDETDNFNQPHYELHNTYHLTDNVTLSNTLYYIRGSGYYEQFKSDRDYADYNLVGQGVPETGDLVRRQWVLKDQIGFNPRMDIKHEAGEFYAGGALYLFDSEHWGEVLWAGGVASSQMLPGHKYYEYFGDKFSGSIYAGENYRLSERFTLSPSLQTKYIRQEFDQTKIGAFEGDNDYTLDWLFLSPRISVGYKLNPNISFSAMAAVSSRTPADYTIYDANDPHAAPSLDTKPERVYDFEIGSSYRNQITNAGVNLYWMEFRNEIVQYGGLNDRGEPITTNAKRSVHAGIEMIAGVKPVHGLSLNGDFSVTYNRFKDYKVTEILYDTDWNAVGTVIADYSDYATGGFPTYLGNLTADFQSGVFRVVGRSRIVGRQYVESSNQRDLSIDPYTIFSLNGSATIANPPGFGKLVISAQVENLFDKKYEASSWSDTYFFRDAPSVVYAYYIPAAERSFFLQLKLELE
jgi:iron complex outermembrane receptor protein